MKALLAKTVQQNTVAAPRRPGMPGGGVAEDNAILSKSVLSILS